MKTVNHWSDCAQHNEPATPNEECNCGGDAPVCSVEDAMNVLTQAMKTDPDYAHGWHCNIAVMCADAIHADESESVDHDMAHRMSNDGASRFMKLCFDVDTKGINK